MEYHKLDSSLDTVLIVDSEEDIKSEKITQYSSLDTLILNYEEPKKQHRHYKSKREHRCRSRNQKLKNTDNVKTKVTREIHVEQQQFKYIINLNTTVCDYNKSHTKHCDEKLSKKSESKTIDRSVPCCLRQQCRQSRHYKTKFPRHSKEFCKADLHQKTGNSKTHECEDNDKQTALQKSRHLTHITHKHRHSKNEKKLSKKNIKDPQLSSPDMQTDSIYEDISTTSLDEYLEIPSSYKYVEKDSDDEYHESKLDTLIKRTKERERKLVAESRKATWYSNTPYTDVSSVEFPVTCSDNASLHSRSTLILEPMDHGYSPSIEGHWQSPEGYLQYSRISENYLYTKCFENDFELKIKSEPTMDIEAYSPTSDLQKLFENQDIVKKEIKMEHSIE